MRLPKPEALELPDHRFLYEHDVREIHNPDNSDFSHLMYMSRFQAVLQAVSRHSSRGCVLDVGCAQGNFSLRLAEDGYTTIAADLRPTFLQYARLKYESGRLHCVAASAEALPFKARSFDIILLGEILEHVAYPERLVSHAASLVKNDGLVIITTPNGERWRLRLPTLAEVHDRTDLVARQFQPDSDGHLFVLTRTEVCGLVKQVGLDVVEHRFLQTGWITGRMLLRHVARFFPASVRGVLDQVTLRIPGLGRRMSEGQLVVARRQW